MKIRSTRAVAAGGALTVVASLAGVALTQAPAFAGTNANTSYEYDCTTALQAGQTGPFEVVANLTAAPDPTFHNGGTFGAGGALTFPLPGSEIAGLTANGITGTGLTISGLTIGSTDGSATGTYTYGAALPLQSFVSTNAAGVSWANASTTLTAAAGTFTASEVGDGITGGAGIPSTATIVAVAGGGASATIQAPTTAAGTGTLKLWSPTVFTDATVNTGGAFTANTTIGGHANIGLLPGTVTGFTLTTSLGVNVPFGGTTGVGNANCLETGWDASSTPGPAQLNGTTPSLPPAAQGGATALVAASGGTQSQAGTTQKITPPTAAFVVGNDPAPTVVANNPYSAVALLHNNLAVTASTPTGDLTGVDPTTWAVSAPDCGGSATISGSATGATVDFLAPGSAGLCHLDVTVKDTAGQLSNTATLNVNVSAGDSLQQDVTQHVNGGNLDLEACGTTYGQAHLASSACSNAMGPISLNGSDQTSHGTIHQVTIIDARGVPVTWALTAQLQGPLLNATYPGDKNGKIAASNLSLAPTCANAPTNGNATVTTGAGGALSAAVPVCSANAGDNTGSFTADGALTLQVPQTVYAGDYTGTINFIVS